MTQILRIALPAVLFVAFTSSPAEAGKWKQLVRRVTGAVPAAVRCEVAGWRKDLGTLRTPEYRGQRSVFVAKVFGKGMQYGGAAIAIAAQWLGGDPTLVQCGGATSLFGTALRVSMRDIDGTLKALDKAGL